MSHNRFIQSFTQVPKELFRLNNGPAVHLRAHPGPLRPAGLFDLLTTEGKVRPLALDPATYEFPNGASMRSNSISQQRLVRRLKGSSALIYTLHAGTELPDDLILVHEFADHYSLQARRSMTVEELNSKITQFLTAKGERLSKEQWQQRYPTATESR
ncbi:hypothetical protein ASPZODRAFT_14844 [Penicilliopsis zonata CBS 506.65]|uniref:Tse2 ADP-ribosyltransferase toxin domain-containing protein n=1 Tax=Penicilliopsis zonata CBS 506.65 TaxID=1073090 RepID=A0A1L9SNE9_9EURO|nr:hypothetical protein ASPZODRAFT_14844 [Penicilliopsis zonata CBS 506.65]OJJ48718.1 hypothetical protein ASPZODRAFT_14844 [Penicilliopsis zonata CBS 506.65]